MSNDVYGYIEPIPGRVETALLNEYISDCSVRIQTITEKGLFNFPREMMPASDVFLFDIADGPNSINATYLIDYYEYDPETSDIGFPPGARDRLNILLDTLNDMFRITNAQRMVVVIAECNQIETIRKIKISDLYNVIHADFEGYQAPPDTLYEISR